MPGTVYLYPVSKERGYPDEKLFWDGQNQWSLTTVN
jgi:hypothetical protein